MVHFDEPVSIDDLSGRLESGGEIVAIGLDESAQQLTLELAAPIERSDRLILESIDDQAQQSNRFQNATTKENFMVLEVTDIATRIHFGKYT